jgi:hypothetical protein
VPPRRRRRRRGMTTLAAHGDVVSALRHQIKTNTNRKYNMGFYYHYYTRHPEYFQVRSPS